MCAHNRLNYLVLCADSRINYLVTYADSSPNILNISCFLGFNYSLKNKQFTIHRILHIHSETAKRFARLQQTWGHPYHILK